MNRTLISLFLVFFSSSCTITFSEEDTFPYANHYKPLKSIKSLTKKASKVFSDYTFEAISIVTVDNIMLRGIHASKKEITDTTVVLFGGNGFSIEKQFIDIFKPLSLLNINLIWFDYRGHGYSDNFSEDIDINKYFNDSIQIIDFAKKLSGSVNTIVHGISAGGFMAMYASTQREVDGIVIQSSTNDYIAIIDAFIPKMLQPFFKVRLEESLILKLEALKSNLEVSNYPGAIYFIANMDDSLIAGELVHQLYRKSISSKKKICSTARVKHAGELESKHCVNLYRNFLISFFYN